MDLAPPCPLCGCQSTFLQTKNGYRLFRCGICDHIFVSPPPDEAVLSALYSFEQGYHHEESLRRYPKTAPARISDDVNSIRGLVARGSVLDVGCSNGEFLHFVRQHGYAVQGVEVNRDTAAIAIENQIPVFVGDLDAARFENGRFDVVRLADVIEHVIDPCALLAECRRILRSGGILLIRTPNHHAFFPRLTYLLSKVGIPWSHPTPPWHVHQFSSRSLSQLLHTYGFEPRAYAFGRCSLRYEIGATGTPGHLKRLVAAKSVARSLSAGALVAVTVVAYSAAYLADRVLVAKKQDFDMRVIALAI